MSNSSKPRHNLMALIACIIFMAIFAIGSGAGIYFWQQNNLESLKKREAILSSQLTAATAQKSKLQAARTISTSGWKTFCDTHNRLCFNYPADWKVANSGNTQIDATDFLAGLQASNPAANINLLYQSHYFKDGIGVTFHVASIDDISDPTLKLKVVGGYFVSENRQPFYVVVDNTLIQYFGHPLKVGQNTIWANTPRFEIINSQGQSIDAIRFGVNAYTQLFPTTQAADAWFQSVNGLTALQIMKSLHSEK